jgi:hypothetical protein
MTSRGDDLYQSSASLVDLSVSRPLSSPTRQPASADLDSPRHPDLSTASTATATATPAVGTSTGTGTGTGKGTSGTLTLKDLEDSSPDVDSNPGSMCVSVLHHRPDSTIVYEDSDRAYSASGFGVASAAVASELESNSVAAARSEAVLASSQWFAHNTSLALSTLSPSVLFNMPSHAMATTPPRGTQVAPTAVAASPGASSPPSDSDVPHAMADGSVSMSFEDATTFAHAAAKLVSEFQQEHPSAWHPHSSLVSSARLVAPPTAFKSVSASASKPRLPVSTPSMNVSGLVSLNYRWCC